MKAAQVLRLMHATQHRLTAQTLQHGTAARTEPRPPERVHGDLTLILIGRFVFETHQKAATNFELLSALMHLKRSSEVTERLELRALYLSTNT